ncbi:hypothetical protein ACFQ5J_08820 [Lacticaseibacillus baoqingensis]|uniref:Lipoprotein n=1 Tax=Lacticaseibacillus baoqingensis TaxID=2486013 RepID=A0ABW4E5Z8_9LACO|nr:hypothetical protein [Lacticaseibacillus baoqingensis]
MKKILATFTLALALLLTACGQKISSNYAGVNIGDAAAKKLNLALPDGKAAIKALGTYKKDDSLKNYKSAAAAVKKLQKTCKDNEPASYAGKYDASTLITTGALKSKDVSQMKGAVAHIVSEYAVESVPEKFFNAPNNSKLGKQLKKVSIQYQKDVGVR